MAVIRNDQKDSGPNTIDRHRMQVGKIKKFFADYNNKNTYIKSYKTFLHRERERSEGVLGLGIELDPAQVNKRTLNETIMTNKQKDYFKALQQFVRANGYAPSYSDLCSLWTMKSKNAVRKMLDQLQKAGKIKKTPAKARTIVIIDN